MSCTISRCVSTLCLAVTLSLACLRMCQGEVPSLPTTTTSTNAPSCGSTTVDPIQQKTVTIGVILPFTGPYFWTRQKTQSAIEYALDTVRHRLGLLPGWNIHADYRDSKCSDTDGPLEAVDMYTKKTAQVFVGPACDYAVAPIARFTKRWDIPVITAGALVKVCTHNFFFLFTCIFLKRYFLRLQHKNIY